MVKAFNKRKGFTPHLSQRGGVEFPFRLFQKKGAGFTLIELLVVIAIIGLLSSIVLVAVGPARQKARDAQRQSDIRQINLAMEMCYDDSACGLGADKYLDKCDTDTCANAVTKIDDNSTSLYLTVPKDPTDVAPNQYTWTNGTDQYYCVYTKLEGTADTWVCASNKGVKTKTSATFLLCSDATAPCNANCCDYNLTQ